MPPSIDSRVGAIAALCTLLIGLELACRAEARESHGERRRTAQQDSYDLLLTGGHVIDPANEIDGVRDVAVRAGRIARVAANIPAQSAKQTIDVTYLADTVIMLRYFEALGRVRRAISAIKKRTGAHEDTIREFQISNRGIAIGPPLHDFQGVLRGVPKYVGKGQPLMEQRA